MNVKAETKVMKNAGSLRTTVPKKIAELLDISEGGCICWELTISKEEGVVLKVTPVLSE